MADFGISIAEKLIEVIGSEIIKKICEMWNYTSELEDLNKTVNTIKNVLLDAESRQELSHSQRDYIDSLRATIYDADDLFDEFLTLAEMKQLDDHEDDKFLKQVCCFLRSKKKGVSQAYRMSQKLNKIKQRLDSIANKHENFKFSSDMEPTKQKANRRISETFSHINKDTMVGREDDQNNVVDMLLSPDVLEDVRCLTIVGVGGLGKTTLAKLVYDDEKIQTEFSDPALRLWVCVSDQDGQEFDVKVILCKILELVSGMKEFDSNSSMELVQTQFKEKLGGKKKFLLILDDVWNEDQREWRVLESLLKLGKRGSRVLITTRSDKTSTIIGKHSYKLKGLSEKHSWNLFKLVAFDKGEEHIDYLEYVELGKKIVEKCHNIPLAIEVVGSLLYGQDISKWRSLNDSDMNEIGHGNNQIMSILKLSYYNLGLSLRRCFSYCAIFPKDKTIKKEMLISLWMAQGYIVPFDGGQNLEDAAEEHFLTLLQRSFFQDVKKDEFGNVISIKIHDLMHDVAQDVGKQETCALSSKSSILRDTTRHVHIASFGSTEKLTFKSKIRSYVHSYYGENIMNSQTIDSWISLRVLDLRGSNIRILPDWIGKLLHLRYLNLSSSLYLKALPGSITELHNLQTLMLNHCHNLKELPEEFGKLVKLRYLSLSSCYGLTIMPAGMEKLSNLRVLPYFVVGKGSKEQCDSGLKSLKSITNIKGSMHLKFGGNLKNVEGTNDKEGECMKNKRHLTNLRLEFHKFGALVEQEGVMEKLEPNSNLKEFILEGYNGQMIPRWGKTRSNWSISFPHLVKIKLEECANLEQFPSLSKLRYLKSLDLHDVGLEYMEGTSNINQQNDKDDSPTLFFPSLESLIIKRMRRFKGWWRWEDDEEDNVHILCRRFRFPTLSYLEINGCPSLKSFALCLLQKENLTLENKNSPQEIVSISEERGYSGGCSSSNKDVRGLEKLTIDKVDYLQSMFADHQSSTSQDSNFPRRSFDQSLRFLEFEDLKDTHLSISTNGVQYMTSLHTLKFWRCAKLETLPEWIGNLTSLQHLSIMYCYALKSLPESMKKLTSLKLLEIQAANSDLEGRCQEPNGEDWINIKHVPSFFINRTECYIDE